MKASDADELYDRMQEISDSIKQDGWVYNGISQGGMVFTNPQEPDIFLTLSLKKHQSNSNKETK